MDMKDEANTEAVELEQMPRAGCKTKTLSTRRRIRREMRSVALLCQGHQIAILSSRIEAWAFFGGILTMSVDSSLGEDAEQYTQEVTEGTLLGFGASVFGSEVMVKTTHIADADAVLVPTRGVCSHLGNGTA